MAKPYDVTFKQLIEKHADDWARFLKVPASARIEVVDSDLSTVSPAADKLFRVHGPSPHILHLEAVSAYHSEDPGRWQVRSSIASFKTELSVRTVSVLLRPEADGPAMTGVLRRRLPEKKRAYLTFRWEIVRAWKLRLKDVLRGGVGVLPLALLLDETQDKLPDVIRVLEERLPREAGPGEVEDLWAMCYILTGLRNSPAVARALFKGVRSMEESTTYQEIIAKGEALGIAKGKSLGIAEGKSLGIAEGKSLGIAEGEALGEIRAARRLLLNVAGKRFGPPDRAMREAVEEIADYDRLEELTERVLDVSSWEELLGEM